MALCPFWPTPEVGCALCYVLGSLLYGAGSALLLPAVATALAASADGTHPAAPAGCFLAGSALFVAGAALHWRIQRRRRSGGSGARTWALRAARAYVAGSLAFLAGSAAFWPAVDASALGAGLFFGGSGLFVAAVALDFCDLGGTAKARATRSLWAAGAANILGSLVFMLASLPYLADAETRRGMSAIQGRVAVLFLFGTACFLTSGTITLVHACRLHRVSSTERDPAGAADMGTTK